MKKIILIATLVLVLLLGCSLILAIVMSNFIEKNLSHVASNLATQSNVKITDFRYEKSLIGASVVTAVQIEGFSAQAVKLKHEICTFPIHLHNDGSPGFGFAYARSMLGEENFTQTQLAEIKEAFQEKEPVIVETILDFGWNYQVALTVNPAESKSESMSFSGLNGNFFIAKDANRFSGRAGSESLRFQSKDGPVEVADFNFTLDQQRNDGGLWIGTSEIKFGKIGAQAANGPFSIRDFSLATQLVDRNETLEWLLDFAIPEIGMPDGLPVNVSSVDYHIDLQNIDAAAASKLMKALEEVHHQLHASSGKDPNHVMHEFAVQNADSIDRLVKANPLLIQKMNVATSRGPVAVNLDLNISSFPQDQSFVNIQDPNQLLQYVGGALHAVSPLTLLQMTPIAPALESYRQQGLLKIEGENAVFDATLANNAISINGQVIPLPL